MEQKILIVDDETHIRMLLEQTLEDVEDEGVELLFADNGASALETIQLEQPSLVFLDVMMPKMNGMEVCQKVKNELGLDQVYIVLLTAKGQEVDKQRGLDMGANLYMTKPFDPDEIVAVAERVLNISISES